MNISASAPVNTLVVNTPVDTLVNTPGNTRENALILDIDRHS